MEDIDSILEELGGTKLDKTPIVATFDSNNTDPNPEAKKKKKKKKKTGDKKEEEDKGENKPDADYFALLPKFAEVTESRFQSNEHLRIIGDWKETPWNQTNPPTKPISDQFPDKIFPIGEIQNYAGEQGLNRTDNEEARERERLMFYDYNGIRKAAECHRQVRKFAQSRVKPGKSLNELCEEIENMNRYLIKKNGLNAGIGFPTGVSLNDCAAHYTTNPGEDKITVEYDDVLKVDFGTHVNGMIVDCAFTVAFNPVYDELLLAAQDATNTGIKEAGIDVRLGDIGAAIQEAMESYEVTIKGKVYW